MNKGFDSIHRIVHDVNLKGGAELHRFKNAVGEELSAIYMNGEELWYNKRSEETRMVECWNKYPEKVIEEIYGGRANRGKAM